MQGDQTREEFGRCTECGAEITEDNYESTDEGYIHKYCPECDTATISEGVGARWDRIIEGESLAEIHDDLPEEVRKSIREGIKDGRASVGDTTVRYMNKDVDTTVNHAEVVEVPEEETCEFPDCHEHEDLTELEGTGEVCEFHHDALTTDLTDREDIADLRRDYPDRGRFKGSDDDWSDDE